MEDITVLVTGGGAPGIMGTIYSLRKNWDERKIRIICVDMNSDVVGRYLCDSFYRVPPGKDERFVSELMDICERERVDVVLPQVTNELVKLAKSKQEFEKLRTKIAVSSEEPIRIANDKYNLLKIAKEIGVPYPKFYMVKNWEEMVKAAEILGYPFIVKPMEGSGMRGFRVVYDALDLKSEFYNSKPDSSKITMSQLHKILGESFPPLLATEYLPGYEYTVDVLSSKDRVYVVVPRKREKIRSGITFVGRVEKRDDIIRYVEKLTEKIGLEYAHGFQFKLDDEGIPKLLESNPRIQGTMILSTIAHANVIYGAVKLALDESLPEFSVRWGARLLRYWGAIGITDGEVYKV